MKKVVISGYYGFDNIGDEAILAALCELFSPYDISLTVLSSSTHFTKREHGVEAIHRLSLPQIVGAMRQADLFISGGGGLLQDVTGMGSIPYYLGLLYLAQKLSRPTMIFAQGIGPIRYGWNRAMVKHVLKKVNAITVREPASVTLLNEIGLPSERIFETADPVLTLKAAPSQRIHDLLSKERVALDRPLLGVCIRPWKSWYEKQLKSFTAVLAQFALNVGAQIVLIPFQRNHDKWLADEAAYSIECRPSSHIPSVIVLQRRYHPCDMMGVINQMDLVVGMRLHSLIMAAAQCIPAVGIVYDPKVRHFSESVGFNYVSSVQALNHSEFFHRQLTDAWENRYETRKKLELQVPSLQKKVYDALIIALQLMGINTC